MQNRVWNFLQKGWKLLWTCKTRIFVNNFQKLWEKEFIFHFVLILKGYYSKNPWIHALYVKCEILMNKFNSKHLLHLQMFKSVFCVKKSYFETWEVQINQYVLGLWNEVLRQTQVVNWSFTWDLLIKAIVLCTFNLWFPLNLSKIRTSYRILIQLVDLTFGFATFKYHSNAKKVK